MIDWWYNCITQRNTNKCAISSTRHLSSSFILLSAFSSLSLCGPFAETFPHSFLFFSVPKVQNPKVGTVIPSFSCLSVSLSFYSILSQTWHGCSCYNLSPCEEINSTITEYKRWRNRDCTGLSIKK